MKVTENFAQGHNTAKLSTADYAAVSKRFGVPTALVRAVVHVEATGAGFWTSGNLKLLYEGHIAFRETKNNKTLQAKLVSAGLAWPRWGDKKYGNAATSRQRLMLALEIAGPRAFRWASYGLPQTMGFNAKLMGYKDAEEMFNTYLLGEQAQLYGMFRFIKNAKLLEALKAHNWHKFAKGYNGAGYARHNYHGRLAAAFAKFSNQETSIVAVDDILRKGMSGKAITDLQQQLNKLFDAGLEIDGIYGRATEQAVRFAQKALGVKQDGVVGPVTFAALEAEKNKLFAAPVDPVERTPLPNASTPLQTIVKKQIPVTPAKTKVTPMQVTVSTLVAVGAAAAVTWWDKISVWFGGFF